MLAIELSSVFIEIAQLLLLPALVLFSLISIDELYFNLRHLVLTLRGDASVQVVNLDPSDRSEAEQAFAILLPAWQAGERLADTVTSIQQSLDFRHYHVFLGVPASDIPTLSIAERLARQFSNVHCVHTRHSTTPTRAEALNSILAAMQQYEKRNEVEFKASLVSAVGVKFHPMTLQHLNRLLPFNDVVQIPLLAAKARWHRIRQGMRMDASAELFLQRLPLQRSMGWPLDTGRAGTAFSRRALLAAELTHGHAFKIDQCPDSYRLSVCPGSHNLRELYSRCRILSNKSHAGYQSGEPVTAVAALDESDAGEHHRAIGRALNGQPRFPWHGTTAARYFFWHRKRPLVLLAGTLLISLSATALALASAFELGIPEGYQPLPLLDRNSSLWWLVLLNGSALALNVWQRHIYTAKVYGAAALVLVCPRIALAWLAEMLTGLKTLTLSIGRTARPNVASQDLYPDFIGHHELRKQLTTQLGERGLLSKKALDQALEFQQKHGGQLGQILIHAGLIKEADVMTRLGNKYQLQTEDVDPFTIPAELYSLLPFELLRKHQVVPVRRDGDVLWLATSHILEEEAVDELELQVQTPIGFLLATQASLFFALHTFARLARVSEDRIPTDGFNLRMLRRGGRTPVTLEDPARPLFSGYMPFGQHVRQLGLISQETLEQELKAAAADGKSLGQHLIDRGLISEQQRNDILRQIEVNYRSIVRDYINGLQQDTPDLFSLPGKTSG